MTPTLESLGLDQLSRSERVAVANALLESVTEFVPSTLTEAQRQELIRRIDDANPDDVISWEEVKAQSRARRNPATT